QEAVIESANSGTGAAGNVEAASQSLTLSNQSRISTDAGENARRAGNITLAVTGDIRLLNESSLSTETVDGFDLDNPASIEVIAGDLLLDGNSSITTNSSGTADAGDIDLRVDNTIKLLANSRLSTESASGGGGQIKVLVNDLLYLRDSAMTTRVEQSGGQGNGGDIFVDPIFIVLDNSVITANAIGGNGGNITLIADYINQSTDSQITASSELGVDGEINIDAFDAEVEAGENNLATDFLDASQWVQQACAQRSGSRVSSFILNQRPPRQSPYDDWSISQEL
ncbi:MAG: large exoprotein involved in heme utilization and adhesion, partial [Cellvibrionaceae bacterium]